MSRGLVARGVTKSFGATRALEGVDIEAPSGSVTAVLGQNGAGKSTLMGILAGALSPDSGSMTLDDAPYAPQSPIDAKRAGVAMVHQELSLCPHLTVAENVLLGALPTRFGLVDWKETERRATIALSPLALEGGIDVRARVRDLSPANQQLVEIARALADASCRVLIFDEPTSSLASGDVERLFACIRSLKQKGFSILYLSHFLEEVKEIADTFCVLRDGKTVGHGEVAQTSIDSMVELLAGRPIENLYPRSERTLGDVVIEIDRLAGMKRPSSATLTVSRGEVVGIAGLLGAGRTELLRAIYGLDKIKSGDIRIKELRGPRSPVERIAQGTGLLSEDRKEEGLAVNLSIADNLTLSKLGGFFVSAARQNKMTAQWTTSLRIRARDPAQRIGELSGGNQQKVAIARLLYDEADVLLLDEPTRGIDVDSKAQIYSLIDAEAAKGKAILMVSSYLPELLGVCDRIYVMRRGELASAVNARDTDEHALLKEATLA